MMMWLPLVMVIAGAFVAGINTTLGDLALRAAQRFTDQESYQALVLQGRAIASVPLQTAVDQPGYLQGSLGALCAMALAAAALYSYRLPGGFMAHLRKTVQPALKAARTIHSGYVGDYVTWFMVGTAVIAIAAVMQ